MELFRKAIKKCHQMVTEEGQEWWLHCKDRIAMLEYHMAGLHISAAIAQVSFIKFAFYLTIFFFFTHTWNAVTSLHEAFLKAHTI
jgi:hypothetical protein